MTVNMTKLNLFYDKLLLTLVLLKKTITALHFVKSRNYAATTMKQPMYKLLH